MGNGTPLAPAFDRIAQMWADIPDGGTMTIHWPTLEVVSPEPVAR